MGMVPAIAPSAAPTNGRLSSMSAPSHTTSPITSIIITNAPVFILMSACTSRISRRRAQLAFCSIRLTSGMLLISTSRRMVLLRFSSGRSYTTSSRRSRIFLLAWARAISTRPGTRISTAKKISALGTTRRRSRLLIPRKFILDHLALAEDGRRDVHTRQLELVGELGTNARRFEVTHDLAILGQAGLAEHEDVLHGDHVLFHTDDFADRHHAARTIRQARGVHDHVEGGADLLAHDAVGKVDAAHQHERLEAMQGVARAVGVNGGERAVVAGVHGLQHVHHFRAAHLTHDDAVGAHTERVLHELALRDLAPVSYTH